MSLARVAYVDVVDLGKQAIPVALRVGPITRPGLADVLRKGELCATSRALGLIIRHSLQA